MKDAPCNDDVRHGVIERLHRAIALMHRGHHMMHGSPHGGMHHHHGQGRVLGRLRGMDGAGQRELAEELGIRPASLTELLDKLEAADLVERRQNEEDKRMVQVYMTEKGKAMAEEAGQSRREMMDKMFAGLDEAECVQLTALLDKLLGGMEQFAGDDGECCGRGMGRGRHGHHHGMHGHGPHGPHGPGPHGPHGPHGMRGCSEKRRDGDE